MASVTNPLDDGSFLYFIRTIPLVVGQTYSFDRYFQARSQSGHHQGRAQGAHQRARRRVRRDRRAAHHQDAKGIFSENGHAEVWLSDDKNRIMLQMKSGLSFGSINLYLTSYRPAPATTTAPTP